MACMMAPGTGCGPRIPMSMSDLPLNLALFGGAAYSQGAVTKAFINAEETIARVVGKRTQAPDGLSTMTSRKVDSAAWQRSLGGVRVPRGVHRFKTHEEAERWLWRMIARPTS